MYILNIFAHLKTKGTILIINPKNKTNLAHIAIMALLVLFCFSQCKNTPDKPKEELSLEDSLANKFGKGSAVIEQLNIDIANAPNNAELYYKRALQWTREDQPQKGFLDIERAIRIQPENPLYYFARGEISFVMDSVTKAMESFEKSVELKPDFVDAIVRLGELKMILFQYDESIKTFNKLIELEPLNPKAYYYKGRNYLGKTDTTSALTNYKKAVEYNNDYYDAYIELGKIFFHRLHA